MDLDRLTNIVEIIFFGLVLVASVFFMYVSRFTFLHASSTEDYMFSAILLIGSLLGIASIFIVAKVGEIKEILTK